MQNGIGNRGGSLAWKRPLAARHFVEDGAEAEEVGACIELLTARLLGRHVRNRSNGDAGSGQDVLRDATDGGKSGYANGFGDAVVVVSHLGETKIENFDVTAPGDEDISRLHVAVNNALAVSGIEAVYDLNGQA